MIKREEESDRERRREKIDPQIEWERGKQGEGAREKPREPLRERRWKILRASERERAYVRER